jgi:hypothetical protein
MSAYASFAPATTNIWADNNYICYINCINEVFAGFAVFSILGNMAYRQRTLAFENPALRVALCINERNTKELGLTCPSNCDLCGEVDWLDLPEAACCGNVDTGNVSAQTFALAFSVRTPPQVLTHTSFSHSTVDSKSLGASHLRGLLILATV